jgi:hypothetical protein
VRTTFAPQTDFEIPLVRQIAAVLSAPAHNLQPAEITRHITKLLEHDGICKFTSGGVTGSAKRYSTHVARLP